MSVAAINRNPLDFDADEESIFECPPRAVDSGTNLESATPILLSNRIVEFNLAQASFPSCDLAFTGLQNLIDLSTGYNSCLEKKFNKLSNTWKKETGHFSVVARRYQHPAYKSILEMKDGAVPLILKSLRRNPDRWFAALEELTHENPAKGSANFYEAVDRWVAWGVANNLIE